MIVVFNNEFKEETEIGLSIDNRGFNYGDGTFETMMAINGTIRFLDDHLVRLNNGLKTLRLSTPEEFSASRLSTIINELIKLNALNGIARIKIIVWRKSGGLFSPMSNEVNFLITAIKGSFNLSPRLEVAVYDEFRLCSSPISHFKKLSSLQYVMGGIYKNEKKVDDIIFLDIDGNVAESLASNIFWSKGDSIYTPSLETGCIDGIMRKQIRLFCNTKGINFNEGKFPLSELINAEMAFVSNVAGINLIQSVDKTTYKIQPSWFQELQDELMHQ